MVAPIPDRENPSVRRKAKGDLWYIETASVPRHDEVCDRFVRRIAPWWGFAVYGVVYAVVSMLAFIAFLCVGLAVGAALGAVDKSIAINVSGFAFGLPAFALVWWHFVRWVKRRRGAARPLIRDGELVQGVVIDPFAGSAVEVARRIATDFAMSRAGVKFYRVSVQHGVDHHVLRIPLTSAAPEPNSSITVLFNPATKYALVFDRAGKAQVATVS